MLLTHHRCSGRDIFTVCDVYRLCCFQLGFDKRHKGLIDLSVQMDGRDVDPFVLRDAFPLILLENTDRIA